MQTPTQQSQLASLLLATLSPDTHTRRHAEQELESVLASADAGPAFASLALDPTSSPALSQISGVMLKKFMDRWWDAENERGLTDEQRSHLLPLLFSGLSLPSSKLRSQFAFSLSIPLLASSPGVMEQLFNLLAHGTQDQVHGAMRVFQEVVRQGDGDGLDLGEVVAGGGGGSGGKGEDERVLGLVRGLGPVLLGVLGNESHSASTRASSIAVFRQCLFTLFMLKEQLPLLASETVGEVLPPWLDAFVVLLQRGDLERELGEGAGREGWEGLGWRREIYKTVETIQRSFPRSLTPTYLATLLPLTTSLLSSLLPFHTLYSLSSTSSTAPPAPTSSEDEETSIDQVVFPILDLLTALTRAGKLHKMFTSSRQTAPTPMLGEAIEAVLGFCQMTTEEEEEWASDPNAFVLEEDDDGEAYSLRIAGGDFVETLLEKYPGPSARVLDQAVKARVSAAQAQRGEGNPDWWKPLESSLFVIGAVSEAVLELLEEEETESLGGTKSFDLKWLFDEVIPKFLGASELPFLQGRSFVVASQFSTALAPSLAAQYLEAAVQVLEAPASVGDGGVGVSVKISAVKTVQNFSRSLPSSLIQPHSHRILSTLVPLITQASEEVLSLLLESLRAILGVAPDSLTPDLMGQLTDVLLDVWSKNVKDMIIASIFEDLFEYLASTPSEDVYVSLMGHALPPLCRAIGAAASTSSSGPSAPEETEAAVLAAAAIELVSSLLRGRTSGPIDPRQAGYVTELGRVVFPVLVGQMGDGEGQGDIEVVQNGTQLVTLLIRKACIPLLSAPLTPSPLDQIFTIIARLLAPTPSPSLHSPSSNSDESRGLFLGDLLVHLLRLAPGEMLNPVLPSLISAIVRRIPSTTYATFQQSLIIPLAYLIHTQFEATLNVLETTRLEDGTTALEVLLKSWAENAETFQGSWAIRVSTLALADLFASERESLGGVGVRGELIQDPGTAGVIQTRSLTRSRPIRYTSIAFPLKALKLILLELSTTASKDAYNTSWDANADEPDSEDDEEDGEGEGEWADDGPSLVRGGAQAKAVDEFGYLGGLGGDEELEMEEDEDLRNDPIATLDLAAHLRTLLQTAYERMDAFGRLAGGLGEGELGVLGGVLA